MDDFSNTNLWEFFKAMAPASCHWHLLTPRRQFQSGCVNILLLCWQTLSYHEATLGGWKEIFFLHTLAGDKGQYEILENYPSVTPAPPLLNCLVLLLPESLLFQVWQKPPFCEQQASNYSNCDTAAVPTKFDQLHSSQNNLTAGRYTSLVGWRYAVLNITKALHGIGVSCRRTASCPWIR